MGAGQTGKREKAKCWTCIASEVLPGMGGSRGSTTGTFESKWGGCVL